LPSIPILGATPNEENTIMTDHAGGDAAETLRRFWEIQDGGDYSRLS
jgi:hypothetical protein